MRDERELGDREIEIESHVESCAELGGGRERERAGLWLDLRACLGFGPRTGPRAACDFRARFSVYGAGCCCTMYGPEGSVGRSQAAARSPVSYRETETARPTRAVCAVVGYRQPPSVRF